jgi:hypothetical protein
MVVRPLCLCEALQCGALSNCSMLQCHSMPLLDGLKGSTDEEQHGVPLSTGSERNPQQWDSPC